MKSAKAILFLYSESFLHPGAGTSAGVIDLPVQREVHTGYPVIPASSLKGSLRELAERKVHKELVEGIFGPELRKKDNQANETGFAGAISINDARLLAFPVRSFTRSFFWVTCPLVLGRFKRDLGIMNIDATWPDLMVDETTKEALIPETGAEGQIFFEEMDFYARIESGITQFTKFLAENIDATLIGGAYHDKIQRDLAVISDSDFNYLVRFGTQVTARTKLTSLKTTNKIQNGDQQEEGNLWYEETLPPECLFYAPIMAEPARGGTAASKLDTGNKVLEELEKNILTEKFLQVGGNETLGQGWCAVCLRRGGEAG